MLVYYVLFGLMALLAWPLCYRRPSSAKSTVYVTVIFLYLFALASLRYNIGSDYFTYYNIYMQIAAIPPGQLFAVDLGEYLGAYIEMGYVLFNRYFALLGAGPQMFYAGASVFCLLPAAFIIRRYSPNIPLSVWLYVALFCFSSTMDFVRQNMGLAVALWGYPFLRRGGWGNVLKFMGFVAAGMTFHMTVGILLFLAPLRQLPFRRWVAGAYLLVTVPVFLFSRELLLWFLEDLLPALNFSLRFSRYADSIYMNPMRIDMAALPLLILILLLVLRKPLQARYPETDVHIHLAVWSVIFWLFAAHHMILARFYIHTVVFAVLAAPMALELYRPDPALAGEKRRLQALAEQGDREAEAALPEVREQLAVERSIYAWFLAGCAVLSFLYFLYGALSGMEMRGHEGMYICFPYESIIPWLNQLP
ncbi:MAG: EpsG family protein [Bacillota bacterium]|nr:EpsG family protein [Bacillota bacterium]